MRFRSGYILDGLDGWMDYAFYGRACDRIFGGDGDVDDTISMSFAHGGTGDERGEIYMFQVLNNVCVVQVRM